MNIAVIGPGALGCLLAARLFAAGEPVCLVDYRPERARALREQGILFTDLDGSREVLSIPVVLPGELAPVDLTILTVKAHQTAAAARHLPELLASGGLALTLQNGLGNLEHLAAVVGPARLLAGVTFVGATRPADGQVIWAGRGATLIGAPTGSRVAPGEAEQVAEVFRRAGLPCQVRKDIEAALWEKLVVNVA
ncbi:MAG: 2-dehydropantoate 2-reductase, partial [Deltaproteobacteria bacterium]|nr:2-dehydropantoate 2-reductase [Deltaproteobacteria bacterium]